MTSLSIILRFQRNCNWRCRLRQFASMTSGKLPSVVALATDARRICSLLAFVQETLWQLHLADARLLINRRKNKVARLLYCKHACHVIKTFIGTTHTLFIHFAVFSFAVNYNLCISKETNQEKGKHIYVIGILMECLSMLHSTFSHCLHAFSLSACFKLTTLPRRVAACNNNRETGLSDQTLL
jgi:hypothetical protein